MDTEKNAKIKLNIGKRRLLMQSPLFAKLLMSVIMIPSQSVRTMGIGIVGEGLFRLVYNPVFVNLLNNEAIVSVLEHELLHICLGHVSIDKTKFKNRDALDIACEVSVNEYVKNVASLPAPVLLQDFDLPSGESTYQRYHKLIFDERLKLKKHIDDHEEWSRGNSDHLSQNSKKSIIKSTIMTDLEEVSRETERAIDRQLIKIIQRELGIGIPVNNNKCGEEPGNTTDSLSCAGSPPKPLPWEKILSYSNIFQEPSLSKPSRRSPELIGIIPGRRIIHRKPNVLVALDTSGSLDNNQLYNIVTQIDILTRFSNITLIQCDTEITKIDVDYKAGSLMMEGINGRGGTSFLPPFAFLKTKSNIDYIIYFTDGISDEVPEKPPQKTKVIWAMVHYSNSPPANWGKIVYI